MEPRMPHGRTCLKLLVFLALLVAGWSPLRGQSVRWFVLDAGEEVDVLGGASTRSIRSAWGQIQGTHHRELALLMNAGMFHADGQPVGLLVHDGQVLAPLNTASGQRGNFFLLPNGVFGVDASGAYRVVPSALAADIAWEEATQSGPMLLVNGAVHPAFNPESTNYNIRNGVGVDAEGRLHVGIATSPITFWDFAAAFLERGCSDALYLDGAISTYATPEEQWPEDGREIGVVLAVWK